MAFTCLYVLSSMIMLLPVNFAFSPSHRRHHMSIDVRGMKSKRRITTLSSNNDNNDIGADNSALIAGSKKKRKSAIQWIACTSTKEVTRAINLYVKEGDIAVELGSQLRESSTALCNAVGSTGSALLVDVVRKFPKVTKKSRELNRMSAMRMEGEEMDFYRDRATFVEVKSFDSWRRVVFFRDIDRTIPNDINREVDVEIEEGSSSSTFPKFNVLVLDAPVISGNDMALNCVSIVKEFLALNDVDDGNECVVIIKSSKLNTLATKLIHAQRLFSGSESLVTRRENNSESKTTSIIATVGVEEYRRTIVDVVDKGDTVLEIGSHFGTTTAFLHAAATNNTIGEEKVFLYRNIQEAASELTLDQIL